MVDWKAMQLKVDLHATGNAPAKIAATGTAASGAAVGLRAMGAAAIAASGPLLVITAAVAGFIMAFKFIKDAISIAIEFEDTMYRTQAVTGATAAQMAVAEGEVRRLGMSTRFTAVEVAKAAQVMAIAGVTFEEMVTDKALERVLQLAEVGGVDVPTAAGIAIAAIKGFRMEMEELQKVNDVLSFTMTRTNVTLLSLGEALKYLGPTAAATGVSIEESAAAIGALGNAGIAGTLAGTQLRGALNKLIAPSDDARRTMENLGMSVFTLTPAGNRAQATLRNVSTELTATKMAAKSVSLELKTVTREMAGMSLDQQRNNLRIMQIRRKAEKQGRDLTSSEIQQISRLEDANADLDLTMGEAGLRRAEMKLESDDLKESQSALGSQFSKLNHEVSSQVMGVTSLIDVMNQLQSTGATTAQIMEIFGIRGGGAILALLGQHEGFVQLVDDLENSQGASEEMARIIGSSTAAEIAEMKSAFDEILLMFGQEFLPILRDEIIPMMRDDFIPMMKDLVPVAKAIVSALGPVIDALILWAEVYNEVDEATKDMGILGSIASGPMMAFGLGAKLVGLADGGIVTQPTLAMVGEAGPEVVIPLDQLQSIMQPYGNMSYVSPPSDTVTASAPSFTIQHMTISGVMNADDVGAVITEALPEALNSAIGMNSRGAGI